MVVFLSSRNMSQVGSLRGAFLLMGVIMEIVKGSRPGASVEGKLRVSKPTDGDRRCDCGRKISRYNPNETCWEHAPIDFGRIRGRPYEGKS